MTAAKRTSKCFLLAIAIFYSIIICSETSMLKFTKVQCEVLNKSIVTIDTCRVRAVSRNLQYATLDARFHDLPITHMVGNFAFMKRANGYKPFLYNFTFKCDFIKHLNPVTKIMWTWFKDNTNVNHSCPFTQDFHMERLENTYLQKALENLPVPMGDYALFTDWTLNKKPAFMAKFYSTIY